MLVMGVTAAGCAVPEAGVAAAGPGRPGVVQACVAARVRLISATAAAVDRKRHANIYHAT